jgi:hypothetical protein
MSDEELWAAILAWAKSGDPWVTDGTGSCD